MGTNIWHKVPLLSAMDWQRHGLCRSDPGLFDDPDRNPGKAERRRVRQAITVCAACPVQKQCLSFGRTGHHWGIFGGQLLRGGVPVPLRELFNRSRLSRSLSAEDKAARAAQRVKAAS